jgi:thioredoxin-related protein
MQKVTRILIFFLIGSILSFSYKGKEKINWISVAELNEKYSKDPRPILMDVYTDWCGWCKQMDRTTYKNDKLAKYINEHYYAVRLNAESMDSLTFNNIKYGYNRRDKSNELAEYLLSGQMEFPTTVFLPSIDARPAALAGYMTAKDMEAPLKYFGEGVYKTKTFIEYNKIAKNEW